MTECPACSEGSSGNQMSEQAANQLGAMLQTGAHTGRWTPSSGGQASDSVSGVWLMVSPPTPASAPTFLVATSSPLITEEEPPQYYPLHLLSIICSLYVLTNPQRHLRSASELHHLSQTACLLSSYLPE